MTTDLTDQRPGLALIDERGAEVIQRTLEQPLFYLVGLQCHVGSQVTDARLYGEAIRQMVPLMAEVRARHGVIMTELNIGGGQGVPYESGDPEMDIDALRDFIDDALDASCAAEHFPARLSWWSRVARSARAPVSRSIGSSGCSHNPAAG
jgi:diaminopimelate decarboxylase